MITRRIGKLLRGKATPLQVMFASVLGALIAFVPGFEQGMGLLVALVLLLLLLNANLGVALLVFLPVRLLALALMQTSFAVGRFLLDGPTQGLFQSWINAPVLAWFGFEYYATTGGLVLGLVVGLLLGWAIVRLMSGLRHKLAGLEEGSERYQRITSKPWVKVLLFLFVGGSHGKRTYAELAARRIGNPVRILGLVVVVLVATGVWFLQGLLAEPVLTQALKSGLEDANGATVDLASVELDLSEGRLALSGLALADPEQLNTDLFRALRIEAQVDTADLLRRRLAVDRLVIARASNGERRETPGERIGAGPAPEEPEPAAEASERTLDDYLAQAEVWKERLAQARRWLEELGSEGEAGGVGVREETLEERLLRQVREFGYAGVRAEHLVEGAPTFLIRELAVEELTSVHLLDEVLDLRAQNLSTHPGLVEGAPQLSLGSRSGKIELALGLDALSADPEQNRVHFAWRGLPVDALGLSVRGTRPVQGGTLDVSLDGGWSAGRVGRIDLPLQVVLRDSVVSLGGRSTHVDEFALPIDLRGPLEAPRIGIDAKALQDALVAAGADELAKQARAELDGQVEEAREKVEEKLGDELGEQAEKLLEGLPFKKKKD